MTEEQKRKPGRPQGSRGKHNLSDPERRTCRVMLHLTPAEFAKILHGAASAGLSVSAYARRRVLRK